MTTKQTIKITKGDLEILGDKLLTEAESAMRGDRLEVKLEESDIKVEFEIVCEHCLGEGEVTTMEQVWPGEPHTAPIGTRKCVCILEDQEKLDD